MKKYILYGVCLCLIFMPTIPAIFASQGQVPDTPDKEVLMARGYGHSGGYRGGGHHGGPVIRHHGGYRHHGPGFFACAPVIP